LGKGSFLREDVPSLPLLLEKRGRSVPEGRGRFWDLPFQFPDPFGGAGEDKAFLRGEKMFLTGVPIPPPPPIPRLSPFEKEERTFSLRRENGNSLSSTHVPSSGDLPQKKEVSPPPEAGSIPTFFCVNYFSLALFLCTSSQSFLLSGSPLPKNFIHPVAYFPSRRQQAPRGPSSHFSPLWRLLFRIIRR